MSIEVGEETVDVVGAGGVALPFVGVVGQEGFVAQIVRFLRTLSMVTLRQSRLWDAPI